MFKWNHVLHTGQSCKAIVGIQIKHDFCFDGWDMHSLHHFLDEVSATCNLMMCGKYIIMGEEHSLFTFTSRNWILINSHHGPIKTQSLASFTGCLWKRAPNEAKWKILFAEKPHEAAARGSRSGLKDQRQLYLLTWELWFHTRNWLRLHHVGSCQHLDPMHHPGFEGFGLPEYVFAVARKDHEPAQSAFPFSVHTCLGMGCYSGSTQHWVGEVHPSEMLLTQHYLLSPRLGQKQRSSFWLSDCDLSSESWSWVSSSTRIWENILIDWLTGSFPIDWSLIDPVVYSLLIH